MIDSWKLLLENPSLVEVTVSTASESPKSESEVGHLFIQPTLSKVKGFSEKGKPRAAEILLEDIEYMAMLFKWRSTTILKAAITGLSETVRKWFLAERYLMKFMGRSQKKTMKNFYSGTFDFRNYEYDVRQKITAKWMYHDYVSDKMHLGIKLNLNIMKKKKSNSVPSVA